MDNITRWLATGRIGTSSRNMALVYLGEEMKLPKSPPWDPADLNRCILLVKAVPEIKEVFPIIASKSKLWNAVIKHWDELVEMFHDEVGEDWSKAKSAPNTYNFMKELYDFEEE